VNSLTIHQSLITIHTRLVAQPFRGQNCFVLLAAITITSIILWAICLFLAVGVAWTRYEKKKTREKFIAELLAMDPDRREKVLSRLRPDVQTDLRQGLTERYRMSQGGR